MILCSPLLEHHQKQSPGTVHGIEKSSATYILFVTLRKFYDRNVVNKYKIYFLLGVMIFNLIDYIYILIKCLLYIYIKCVL